MECPQTPELSNKEYLQFFRKKAWQQRIPISGSLALTHRCNLRCVHCYLDNKTAHQENAGRELSTAQWLSIIDEITEAGCLFLVITGGEPLLRKDFAEIYRHAKTNGLMVSVFTNGTLIAEDILALFEEIPPRAVEISLYGATTATYERVTGVKGSYNRCIEGIQALLKLQLHVNLKTVLMSYNRHEFYDIEKMAKEYGVAFRFDSELFPCLNGDKTPLELRIPPEEVVKKEFSDEERVQFWLELFERNQTLSGVDDSLYRCGAGRIGFHIEPYGNLQPCLMKANLQYDLEKGKFGEGWRDVISQISQKKVRQGYICNQCDKKWACGGCPAFFELENGLEEMRSEYLCTLGHYRFNMLRNFVKGEEYVSI